MAEKQVNDKQESSASNPEKAKTPEKNNKTKISIAIIIVLLVATVAAMAAMMVTKNLFGGRDSMLDFLTSMDPFYETVQEREATLEELKYELTSREEAVVKKEATLAQEEAKLEDKAEALQHKLVNSSFELYVAGLSEERIIQLEQLGTIYSGMEPEQAAVALPELGSTLDMAVVIYFMEPQSSAEVLNCIDAEFAAQITESLLT